MITGVSNSSAAACERDSSPPLVAAGGFWPSAFLWYKSSRPPSVLWTGDNHQSSSDQIIPVPSPARTRDVRVGLRNISVRWVHLLGEDGNHVFGECGSARLLASPSPSSRRRHGTGLALGDVFTATFMHYIERDDYINKAPCRFWVLPALPLGMLILLSKLQSLWLV